MADKETYVGSLRDKSVKVEVTIEDGKTVQGKISGPVKNYSKPVHEAADDSK